MNQSQNWTIEQAKYIQQNSEVGSPLWREAGWVLAAEQQFIQGGIEYRRTHRSPEIKKLVKKDS